MYAKYYFACLLALAGSLSIRSANDKRARITPSHRAANHQQTRSLESHTRTAPALPASRDISKSVLKTRAASLANQFAFEPNAGQADPSAQFVGRGKGMTILLVRDGFKVVLPNHAQNMTHHHGESGTRSSPDAILGISLMQSASLSWTGEEKQRAETNYFVGSDPSKWRTRVPRYARAASLNTPNEAGFNVYSNQEGFEYDLRVPPGMDPTKLRLALSGWKQTRLDQNGDLLISVAGNEIRMRKPAIYEEFTDAEQPQASAGSSVNVYRKPSVKRSPAVRRKPSGAGGPKKRTRRRTPASIQKAQRHRERKKIRGSNARPPAMRRPRANPPQKRTRPPNADRPTAGLRGNGRKKPVEGGYVLEADGTVGFRVGPHDATATLVLDPSISIVYSSFLGGTGNDSANSLAADSSGNLYVGGTTTSAATFPESKNSLIGPTGGAADLFIAKIDPSKSGADSLVYLTFLGGAGNESGGLVAVDSSGNVAIAGTTTSTDFPVTDGSKLGTGPNAATISEIDLAGSTLVYSTIFGGNGTEAAQGAGGIAFDSSGDIFVASDTSSTNLPVTTGAFQATYGGGISDGFLAFFKPSSTPHLKYCTYFGFSAQAAVGGVAVDAAGNAYIAGFTTNPGASFPSKNAFQATYAGDPDDSYLMKISPGGKGAADLIYATLLGGQDLDEAYAVAVDTSTPPNAYVTGTTQSTNFPTSSTVVPYSSTLHTNATANAFLSVVAQNATTGITSLIYSTYLGGSEADAGVGIAVTEPNSVYVTGSTTSFDFPWLNNLQPYNGNGDAFVAKLDPTSAGAASLIYSTPLGGTAPAGGTVTTVGQALAAGTAGGLTSVYVAGQTTAADFPTAGNPANGFQLICGSCQESPPSSNGFVVEIDESAASEPSVYFSAANLNFGMQPIASTNVPPQFAGVYNGGESPLQISNVGITGPNASDFSLLNSGDCLSSAIAPGSLCSFGVGFVPSIVGPEAATVTFTTNAPGNPQVLEVMGIGEGPIASRSTADIVFGNQIIGTKSALQTITITNTGNEALNFTSVVQGGADVGSFLADSGNTCVAAGTVNVGASCTYALAFAPNATANFSAELTFTDNSGGVAGSEQIVQFTGVGVPPGPIANLQPAALVFGAQAVGSIGSAQTVTLTNTGSAGLNLTSIAITGANAADFGIASSGTIPCPMANGTIVSGANCTVGIVFAPKTGGAKTASLSFTDDANGSPQSVQLTGTATTPSIQISPTSLNFNSQSEGTTSAPQIVTLTNSGNASLAINSISITGANLGDFVATNNCPPSLGAGLICVANISFKPSASGSRTASVSIADNVAGSPQTIPLAGTGTQAAVSLSPASISFGNQLIGAPNPPSVKITVTNTGTGSLTLSAAATSGTNASDFTVGANTCEGANVSIAPNGTCTLQVTFTPACSNSAAARSATLTLTDNAPGSPQSIPLSGTATGNFCVVAPAGSLSATVASGVTATYSLNLMAANGFAGSVALATSSCPPSAICTVSTTSINVAGNTQIPFHVTVATKSSTAAARRFGEPGGIWTKLTERRFVLSSFLNFKFEWLLMFVGLLALIAARGKVKGSFRRFVQTATLGIVFAIGIAACGGGSSGGGGGGTDPLTPAGTYMITLTGTANGTAQTTTLTLTVQ